MKQKKILLLGGSHGQLPAIAEARKRGLYTILCDYLPDNPGRNLVDEYHEISTTDFESVLNLAKRRQIDAILAYASDPAIRTVACVSEKLNLLRNPPKAIHKLSNKKEFRNLQRKENFNVPWFITINSEQLDSIEHTKINYPVVVKPVDSSDTKGVFKVAGSSEFREKARVSLSFSKSKTIIIEEYIDIGMGNLHGDAFFVDGEMAFCMLGDRLFNSLSNPLKPSTELYPSRLTDNWISKVEQEVSAIVKKTGFKNGPVNIEARIDSKSEIYIMEVGPRSGGTLTPQTIFYSCGFDMMKATFDQILRESINIKLKEATPSVCYALHVNKAGEFRGINLPKGLYRYVKEKHLYVSPGERVKPYSEPGSTIGVLILSFPDFNIADKYVNHLYKIVQSSIKIT